MKKYLVFFLVMAFGFLEVNAQGSGNKVDGVSYVFNTEDNTAIVGENSDYAGESDLVIPATVTYGGKSYTVTQIAEGAFFACKALQSVTIPNTIKTIAINVFANCDQLKSVKLPNSITSIGNSAFVGCTALKYIIIPESVVEIDVSAFNGCLNLEFVICKGNAPLLGYQVFNNCDSLLRIFVHSAYLQGYNENAEWSKYTNKFSTIEFASEIGSRLLLGTLSEEQAGPAVEVTDKEGVTLKLYNPQNVKFTKVKP